MGDDSKADETAPAAGGCGRPCSSRPGYPVRRWLRLRWLWAKRLFLQMVRGASSPRAIAMGVAIGLVVGWLPIVGIQMVVAVPICLLLRANFLAAVLPIWLTNPATIVPVFGFNYWVGLKLVGGPCIGEFLGRLAELRSLRLDADATWGEMGSAIWSLTLDFMLPLWTGCLVVGFAMAIPAFFLVYSLVVRFRARLEERRACRRAGLGL